MKQKLLNSFRLKATLLVAVLCALFTGTAWADTVTFDATTDVTTGAQSYQTTEKTYTATDGSKWKANGYGATANTSLVIGKGGANYLETPAVNGTITSVAVTWSGNASYYLALQTTSGTELEAKSNPSSSSTETFTVSGSYSQLRLVGRRSSGTSNAAATITRVVVTYTASGGSTPTCATPTFSPAAGSVASGTEVEITTTTDGATIYYTMGDNPADPTTSSNVYSDPIEITAATTIKAIAVKTDYNNSAVASASYTVITPVPGYTIDFESSLEAYTDWTITNAVQATNGDNANISAHGGTHYGTTGGKQTASIQTKTILALPGTFTCYVSKQTTNTTSSTWYIQVSSDGSAWTDVETKSATSMSAGTWEVFTANLEAYSDVYVRLYYNGSTAVRNVDDISITMRDPSSKVTPTVAIDATGLTTTDLAGSTNVNAGTLAATVTSGETPIASPAVTWSSSDTGVATVNSTSGAVTLIATGTTTITASFAGNDDYNEATDTYELTVTNSYAKGQSNNPYTVAEAIYAIDNSGNVTDVYVRGIVCTGGSSLSSGAMNYWISDDGTETNKFEIYRGKGISNANFTSTDDIQVGDLVVVYGNIVLYNSTTYEFSQGSQLVSRTEKPANDLTKTSDIALDIKNNALTANIADHINSSSTGAYTYESADPTVATVSAGGVVTGLKVGSTTITVNQAATLSYKAGTVEIPVTVSDTRTAASTIPGINISTLAEGAADGTIEVVNPVKADEGATFSFASSNEDVLLIVDDAYTVGEVGTATVTVTATPSNTNLYKPVVANFNVTVQAAVMEENEIILASSSGSTVYGTPLNVNYTVADGYDGTMSYSIDNNAIADVTIGASAITFTPKAVGSTTVTISAPATGNFLEADDVVYTLTVNAPEGKTTAFEAGTVVLDFTQNGWNLPVTSTNGLTEENSYTDNGITITLAASTKYYLSSATGGYLMLGKTNSTLTLPAFDKAVTQIDVEGTSGASTSVEQNIYVDETAVSTATTGAKNVTNEYEIDPDYQAAGNIYTLKVTSNHNTQITNITVHFKGITAKLNASGYATFCSEYPLDFSSATDYSAWQITGISGETITFEKITGSVKGGTGLFLMGTANETVTLTSANSTSTLDDNLLNGTTAPTFVEKDAVYGLSGDKFVPSSKDGVIPAGKAYLDVKDVLGISTVKAFTFVFVDPTTGITETRQATREEVEGIFNLAGQRLGKMQKGINIVNGKKVLVK